MTLRFSHYHIQLRAYHRNFFLRWWRVWAEFDYYFGLVNGGVRNGVFCGAYGQFMKCVAGVVVLLNFGSGS
jgi:hypothetical protein